MYGYTRIYTGSIQTTNNSKRICIKLHVELVRPRSQNVFLVAIARYSMDIFQPENVML